MSLLVLPLTKAAKALKNFISSTGDMRLDELLRYVVRSLSTCLLLFLYSFVVPSLTPSVFSFAYNHKLNSLWYMYLHSLCINHLDSLSFRLSPFIFISSILISV